MTREREYVLGMLRHFFDRDMPRPRPAPDMDRDRLATIAAHQRLGPLFFGLAPSVEAEPEVYERWRREQHRVFIRNSRALRAARDFTEVLEKAGVPSAVTRGLVMAYGYYPGPETRFMNDVDILVPPPAIGAAEAALAAAGQVPARRLRGQFVYIHHEMDIELHWSFLTPKRYRSAFDEGGMLGRRIEAEVPGGGIFRLSPEDELVGQVCHAFIHHHLDHLTCLLDIAFLARDADVDWGLVESFARGAGLSRMFGFTLSFVDRALGQELSPWREMFGDGGDFVPLFDAYLARIFGEDSLGQHLRRKGNQFRVAENNSTRIRQLLRLFAGDEFKSMLHAIRNDEFDQAPPGL